MQLSSHIALAVEAVVLVRLATGLWRRYPWFALMIAGGAGQHIALRAFTSSYRSIWIVTSPILILFQILAAYELYRQWCQRWPGRSGYGSVLAAGLAVGIAALAGFSLAPAPTAVQWITEIQRDVAYVLALALIVTIRVFWIQPHWPRPLLIHTGVMVGWFSLAALTLILFAINKDWRAMTNEINNWVRAILLGVWAIWMRNDDMTPSPQIDRRAAAAEERAIAEDLQAPPPGPEELRGSLATPVHDGPPATPA